MSLNLYPTVVPHSPHHSPYRSLSAASALLYIAQLQPRVLQHQRSVQLQDSAATLLAAGKCQQMPQPHLHLSIRQLIPAATRWQ
jgi:hypothetical protein